MELLLPAAFVGACVEAPEPELFSIWAKSDVCGLADDGLEELYCE